VGGGNDEERGHIAVPIERHRRAPRHASPFAFGGAIVHTLLKTSFAFLATGPQLVGSLLVADGLLPFRSRGPNVSPIEITVGLVLIALGWLIRRVGKRIVQDRAA